MKEGRFVLGTFRSKRMQVLYRSRRNDRLRVMLVLVHIDITPPQMLYANENRKWHLLSSDLFSVWFGNSSNDHQARRRFVEWAQNEIAVVPDFHKRILFSDEAYFWLNGYVNKQNYRICSEANPQVYVETPLHPEKLTVWCALWAGGILLQKR
ncbi:DUF4817 domain-containing protein [Trichonephila clavipes]|nr:DUF4817 domain-containing protein [Trichonephila clavipes]